MRSGGCRALSQTARRRCSGGLGRQNCTLRASARGRGGGSRAAIWVLRKMVEFSALCLAASEPAPRLSVRCRFEAIVTVTLEFALRWSGYGDFGVAKKWRVLP